MSAVAFDPRITRLASGIVHIDLLYACDLDCTHCYLAVRQAKGLSTERYFQLIDEVHEAGFLAVGLSGGEIFLRKDTLDIIAHARAKRMIVTLITHGGRITDDIADALAHLGIHRVGISLYSMVPEDHEAVTRAPGSHARTIAGIERLRARDIPVRLKIPIMQENADSWAGILPWAERLGCEVQTTSEIYAKNDLDTAHIDAMSVDFATRVAIERRALEHHLDQGRAWERAPEAVMDDGLCGAGHYTAYVDPFGKVFPCVVFYKAAGDLAEHSFSEVWDQSPLLDEVRASTKRSFPACQECDFVRDCNHCLAINFQHTGDMHTRSPLVCSTTHARFTAAHEIGLHERPVSLPDDLLRLEPQTRRPPCSVEAAGGDGDACGSSSCGPSPAPAHSDMKVPSIVEMAQPRP